MADSLPYPTSPVAWGYPLVDAHAEVCFLVAVRMLKQLLLLFSVPPEAAVLPRAVSYSTVSFLAHSAVTATIQGAGSACVQSHHLFSVAASL